MNRVAYHRQRLGLSQEQLAAAAFTTQQSISRIEKGEQTPSAGMKVLIAQALDVPLYLVFPVVEVSA